MKSVIIRKIEDFNKITDDTEEIEMVEYDGKFAFTDNCILPGMTFTRMNVYLDFLPVSLEKLGLYNCEFEAKYLERFTNVKQLIITNKEIDIKLFSMLKIKNLRLDYCMVKNHELISSFNELESLSLYNTAIEDLSVLFKLDSLKEVIVDDDMYENNWELFNDLSKEGVLVTDMMGGIFNEV